MTSDSSQIQSLIKEIDEVLSKTTPRLPWVMSSDAAQQRQVLEQTRSYLLKSLQQAESTEMNARNTTGSVTNPVNQNPATPPAPIVTEASAQQVLQAVVQEMNYLRSNMLQPMRSDVDALRLQREALMQEIRQLEMQRQQYQMPQNSQAITEFLRAAMAQMQENLAGQMAQMMAPLMSQSPDVQRLAGSTPPTGLEGDPSPASTLSPAERLQYMQRLQAQSDQLMLRLDATLRVVFDSLQSNLTSYRDALEEGLGRMHETGQQGEAVFGAFVTRLAQMVGREASPFLQGQSGDWRSDRPSLRQAGIKEEADSQINQLLQELNALDPSPLQQTIPGEPIPFDPSLATPETIPADPETASLEQLDRELSRLDLMAIPAEVELLENDLALLSEAPFPETVLDSEPKAEETPFLEPVEPMLSQPNAGLTEAELESALDLLSQITADPAPLAAQADETPIVAPAPPAETPLVDQPETLYEDEFYQSLFGQPPVGESVSPKVESVSPEVDDAFPVEIADLLYEESEAEAMPTGVEPEPDTDLFAGLPDPALEVIEATETPVLPISTPPFPQAIGDLLFHSPDPEVAPEAETLESFFVGEEEQSGLAMPDTTSASIETIASLLELVPEQTETTAHSLAQPEVQPISDSLEESYELAQPGEDLLANPIPSHQPGISELELPPDTLQQLTADLSNLEATRNASPNLNDESWQLVDWMAQSPTADSDTLNAPEVESASFKPAVPDITLEDLLFGEDLDGVVAEPSTAPDFTAIDPLAEPVAPTPEFQTADELLESTIEDWFASVEAESNETRPNETRPNETGLNQAGLNQSPVGNPETDTSSDLFEWYEQASRQKSEEEANAFTLDGLEDLFEGVPAIGKSASAEKQNHAESPALTIENAFGEGEPTTAHDTATQDTAARDTFPEGEKKKRRLGS